MELTNQNQQLEQEKPEPGNQTVQSNQSNSKHWLVVLGIFTLFIVALLFRLSSLKLTNLVKVVNSPTPKVTTSFLPPNSINYPTKNAVTPGPTRNPLYDTTVYEDISNDKKILTTKYYSITIPKGWTYETSIYEPVQNYPEYSSLFLVLKSGDYKEDEIGYTIAGYQIFLNYGGYFYGTDRRETLLEKQVVSWAGQNSDLLIYRGKEGTSMSDYMIITGKTDNGTPFEISTMGDNEVELKMHKDQFIEITKSLQLLYQ